MNITVTNQDLKKKKKKVETMGEGAEAGDNH